jgi:hypothetical protein
MMTRGEECSMVNDDHGPQVKGAVSYENLRRKGMSKERAARIANTPGSYRQISPNPRKEVSNENN